MNIEKRVEYLEDKLKLLEQYFNSIEHKIEHLYDGIEKCFKKIEELERIIGAELFKELIDEEEKRENIIELSKDLEENPEKYKTLSNTINYRFVSMNKGFIHGNGQERKEEKEVK